MVGLMAWPTYTHQEVIDVIDLLPAECTEDYDRVILLQKLYTLLVFFIKSTKCQSLPYPPHPPPTQTPLNSK